MAISAVGRYQILKTLGRGATGVVYLAHDPMIDRVVALKTLRLDLDADLADELRERFLREARAAGRLSHPGIVAVHDVGEDAATGLAFIAMEFVEGRNLKEILADGHRPSPPASARLVASVASALAYAHRMGVVHRDVKPANILITSRGTTKITDFGIARLDTSNLTMDGQFLGTPNYMAPEQVTGGAVDGRTDLFSLGVVLFELLTGERPFPGTTLHEVTRRIVDEPAPIPSVVGKGLSPAFNPVVLKCLEKRPEDRFQDGDELGAVLAALARSLAGAGGAAPRAATPTTGPSRTGPPPLPVTADDTTAVSLGRRLAAVVERVRALPLPEPLRWVVEPRWVLRVVAAWVLLWLAVIGLLASRRDQGPFPAPAVAVIHGLHRSGATLREAERLLPGDPQAAAAAALATLDQAPASPGARRLLAAARYRLAEAARGESQRQQAEVLVAQGRELYRHGDYDGAADQFEAALDLRPDDELAASFLELARERASRGTGGGTGTVQAPRAASRRARVSQVHPLAAATEPARVTVFFESPLNAGTVVVTVDGESVANVPFDFTRKGFLGLKKKGTGQVKRVITVPAGRHVVAVQLSDAERGLLGQASFSRELPASSEWTLRVVLPTIGDRPAFYLVKAAT